MAVQVTVPVQFAQGMNTSSPYECSEKLQATSESVDGPQLHKEFHQ